MWKALKQTLIAIASSKKGVAAVAAAVSWGVGRIGLDLPPEQVIGITGPLVGYVLAQGVADHGKGAAEMQGGLDELAARTAAIVERVEQFEKSLGGGKGGIGTSP